MNGTNGNEPGYPENALVPYPVIVAATTNGLLAVGKASHHASSVRSPRPPDKQRLRNPAREEQGSRSI